MVVAYIHKIFPHVGFWSYPLPPPLIPDKLKTSLENRLFTTMASTGRKRGGYGHKTCPRPLPPATTCAVTRNNGSMPRKHVADDLDLDREGRNRPRTPAASLYLSSAPRACLAPTGPIGHALRVLLPFLVLPAPPAAAAPPSPARHGGVATSRATVPRTGGRSNGQDQQ